VLSHSVALLEELQHDLLGVLVGPQPHLYPPSPHALILYVVMIHSHRNNLLHIRYFLEIVLVGGGRESLEV